MTGSRKHHASEEKAASLKGRLGEPVFVFDLCDQQRSSQAFRFICGDSRRPRT